MSNGKLRLRQAYSVVCVGILLCSCQPANKRQAGTVRDTQASYTLTATALWRAYASDEVAADSKYKDRVVYLTGQVENVESDLMDAYLVRLRAGTNWGDIVSCKCSRSQMDQLTKLTKGSYVRIKGRCSGKMPIPTMVDCLLVDEKGSPLVD